MAISFTTTVVGGTIGGNVAADANYQAPGNFALASNQVDGTGEIRLLNLIEVVRSYMNDCATRSEATAARDILIRMMTQLHNGGSAEAGRAQTKAMKSFAAGWRNTTI